MNLIATFNNEQVGEEKVMSFLYRRASRGVVFDHYDNVCLLYVRSEGYYTLPGGEVEETETYEEGLIRECREEIGCAIEIIKYIGTTREYRKNDLLLNESWGYIATIVGEKGFPILTGDEDSAERES